MSGGQQSPQVQQALSQLQGAVGPNGQPAGMGSTGFVPPQGAAQAFQQGLQGMPAQGAMPAQASGGPGGFQQFAGAPPVGGNPGFQAPAAQQFAQSNAGLANPMQSQMPQWQRGLMGLVTGSPAYGQNAPQLSQLARNSLGQLAQSTMQMGAPGGAPQAQMQRRGGLQMPQMPASVAGQVPQSAGMIRPPWAQ